MSMEGRGCTYRLTGASPLNKKFKKKKKKCINNPRKWRHWKFDMMLLVGCMPHLENTYPIYNLQGHVNNFVIQRAKNSITVIKWMWMCYWCLFKPSEYLSQQRIYHLRSDKNLYSKIWNFKCSNKLAWIKVFKSEQRWARIFPYWGQSRYEAY